LGVLLEEIERGDSEVKLYAGLLARKLVVGDEALMKEFGERIAKLQPHQRRQQAINRNGRA
jgi:hypothetical protein